MKGLQRIFSPPNNLDNEEGKPDPKRDFREKVNLILPDSLMIVLALIMVPIVVLQLLEGLPEWVYIFLSFIDYTVLGIFIIEYVLKTIAARNILKHIINPWHLLDLLIIVIPVVNLLTSTFMRLGTSSLLLRLFRIFRLLAIGGRAIDRKVQISASSPAVVEKTILPLQIQVIDGTLENRFENVSPEGCQEYLQSPSQTWIQIAPVSEADLDLISKALGVPQNNIGERAHRRFLSQSRPFRAFLHNLRPDSGYEKMSKRPGAFLSKPDGFINDLLETKRDNPF